MKRFLLLGLVAVSLYGRDTVLEELYTEIADLKHTLHTYEVDLRIAEEKIKKQESSTKQQPKMTGLEDKLLILEKKVALLEKSLEKVQTHATQIETKLSEVGKLKDMLSSLSKPAKKESVPVTVSSKTYKVKGGDSLEKIARLEHVTVEALKKANQMENDKIFVGQTLKIPE